MHTLIDDERLIQHAHQFYANISDETTFPDGINLLCNTMRAVAQSDKTAGYPSTGSINQDDTVKLVLQGIMRRGYGAECTDIPITEYINATTWCERGFKETQGEQSSPLTQRDHDTALDVGDACNGLAVAHSLEAAATRITADCAASKERGLTASPWTHPITTLYLTQLQHLAGGAEQVWSDTNAIHADLEQAADDAYLQAAKEPAQTNTAPTPNAM